MLDTGEKRGIMITEKAPVSYTHLPDRRQAIYYALDHARAGDIVAILGKGHETTIERNGVKEPFVEREIVEEYMAR